uniref:Uncharacterized protein n=3 Tax=Hemiselmis andersenii TaxID=464988 RepID=A0A6U4WXG0_HEMAN|mmetsp:Transcript_33554/g.81785  ORF Transcript_33554/g.81785 Transcript_33554/m.81785 type:complete len:131 (+) Transcript_33554:124-516(+)
MLGLRDSEASVREASIQECKGGSVAPMGHARAVSALLQHVQHAYPATRQAALAALPHICPAKQDPHMSAVPAIVVCLSDTDWAVRREAAKCAGMLGDRLEERMMQALNGLLEDEEAHVAEAAKKALQQLV